MIRGEMTESTQRGARIEPLSSGPEMHGYRHLDPGIEIIQRLGAGRFGVARSGELESAGHCGYFPVQRCLVGLTVSSRAQKGMDQTKSAEVPVRLSPGIPTKMGGL